METSETLTVPHAVLERGCGDGYAETEERLEQQLAAAFKMLAAVVVGAAWIQGVPVPVLVP